MRQSLTAACLLAMIATLPAHAGPKAPQMLVVSFDGAGENRMWVKSREMAKRTGARFTYFLSCTNLIDRPRADSYKAPGRKAGRSNVGFAPTTADVRVRLDHIWNARAEGHEIASHGCGHFDGADWTREDWLTEMASFDRVLKNAWKDAGIGDREPADWQDFVQHEITGFRAPYLSTGPALIEAERKHGYRYDASPVARGPEWPDEDGGVYLFGLPLIPEGPSARKIVAMDYNLFVRHSMAVDNPSRSAEFEDRAYKAFRAAFDREYEGDRNPLQIGLHFPQMNDGAYWHAIDRLLGEVCQREDVACVTYAEVVKASEARQAKRDDETTFGPSQ
ncbi:polysaccharide deacetylase family protein [Ciceribacter sp. L1K22]|uniref:polysaccharide deacetylase family protein n=1 Tax=Ciceribacter sp. L1K22 TaxID=2820275 RepID=UPI001FF057FF|nr:polysaccharide deacetylase family protein [Ciceribacter sp. L1K22]